MIFWTQFWVSFWDEIVTDVMYRHAEREAAIILGSIKL